MEKMDICPIIEKLEKKYSCEIIHRWGGTYDSVTFLAFSNTEPEKRFTWSFAGRELVDLMSNITWFENRVEHVLEDNFGNKNRIQRPVSDCLFIGFDYSTDDDVTALAVTRIDGTKATVLNVFSGEEAQEIYEKLTGIKMKEGDSVMLVNREAATPLIWNHNPNDEVVGQSTIKDVGDGILVRVTKTDSDNFKYLRKKIGVSQNRMIEITGLSRYAVRNIENGRHAKEMDINIYKGTLSRLMRGDKE